jgi:hypothetical protein
VDARNGLAPVLLNDDGDRGQLGLARLLENKELLRVLDEHLGLAQPKLLLRHLVKLENFLGAGARGAAPLDPGAGAGHLEAAQKALVSLAKAKARATHAHILQQAEIAQLVAKAVFLDGQSALGLVGLDAAHVAGLALAQRVNQGRERALELGAGRVGPLHRVRGHVLEHHGHQRILRAVD